eukprot:COSAG05_NODE_125_length_17331_cov_16.188058_15_plen_131_part_00
MATSFRTFRTRLGEDPNAVRDACRHLDELGIDMLHYPQIVRYDHASTEQGQYVAENRKASHHYSPNVAGFHCSWCFGPEEFRDKLASMTPGDEVYRDDHFKSQSWSDSRIAMMHKEGTWLDGTVHGRNTC